MRRWITLVETMLFEDRVSVLRQKFDIDDALFQRAVDLSGLEWEDFSDLAGLAATAWKSLLSEYPG